MIYDKKINIPNHDCLYNYFFCKKYLICRIYKMPFKKTQLRAGLIGLSAFSLAWALLGKQMFPSDEVKVDKDAAQWDATHVAVGAAIAGVAFSLARRNNMGVADGSDGK
jgi:hypothetical protein